ncbi:MAG: Xaa-Pro peptidase family protein [Anaerolineaceae bacterium]|nr:Xaa-Pro peptidase family protein [Anaerolineaceae bacterium]
MNAYSQERLVNFLKQHSLAALLLSDAHSLTWLTGYAPPIQTGPNPFEGGPALAWVMGEQVTLVLSDAESAAARACGADVQEYLSYTIDAPIAGLLNQAEALVKLLSASGSLKGRVGVEMNQLPPPLLEKLRDLLPLASLQPVDGQLDRLRAVKSPPELTRLRDALALCDLAQSETRKLIQPGRTEIELWSGVKARLEFQAGGRLPVLADFIAGARTAEIGGLPGLYPLQAGDAVIADIVPRLDGYWGDNAGTHFVGEPSQELRRMYTVVLETLRRGIQMVRPGLKARDLDSQLRSLIRDQGFPVYPHHSGHGLGVSYHEEPRLVPYNEMKLETGMVIAIEPGIYIPGVGGVRLEDVVLVTDSGCEVLTSHLGNT